MPELDSPPMRPVRQRRWQETDDLGFPAESDPVAFALAFVAVSREWDIHARCPVRRRRCEDIDDLNLSSEGDPADFARAFHTIREPR